ncbi:unnamed protein product [Gemmataceae bacterium]|nr:unnamed protein product [Gemmataceae bacterium]VTT97539.1 unnamed protein product [Gemmataceae bacterium]
MTPGLRRTALSAAFLGLALAVAPGPARGQDSPHRIWQHSLSPEQVREALARMGAGENGLDPFQEMVKDHLLKNNPGLQGGQADEIIKRLTSDKKLMDQLKQLAKQKQTDPGRPGKVSPDDLTKLLDHRTNAKQPPVRPDIDFKGIKLPRFDPPKTDPKVDPDPAPKVDPKADPAPKVDPGPEPPAPDLPAPPQLKDNPNTLRLDESPFPEPEEPTDARSKSLRAFAALWERNIGPLSETPEVQRALFEAIGENGFDFDMKDDNGNSLWDLLKAGDGANLGDALGNTGGGNWNLGNWEFPRLGDLFSGWRTPNAPAPNWSPADGPRPNLPSAGWSFGSGTGGLGGSWTPLVLLLVAAAGVFLWFKLRNLRTAAARGAALAAAGLGPWPVDPRRITTREDVVKAFEYLSVLLCGPAARNWTHGTIAAALADVAARDPRAGSGLARLYELARYAPLDEALTNTELAEARTLACSLAGVSH